MRPPYSVEAEQAVLGAILYKNEILEVLPRLAPELFHDPIHRRIFELCSTRIARGELADAITLREVMSAEGNLRDIGGASFLLTLIQNGAKVDRHAITYANHLHDLFARRSLMDLGAMAMEAAAGPQDGETVASMLARTEAALAGIQAGDSAPDIGLREAGDGVVEELRRPHTPGIPTGLAELDKIYGGLHIPDLLIIAGRPGMGKSSLALNVAVNVARSPLVDPDGQKLRDRVVAFFSLEMGAEQLAMRSLARFSFGTPQPFGYADFRSVRRPQADIAAGFAKRLPNSLRIVDRGQQTVATMASTCRSIRKKHGALDLVVIDYLQLMSDEAKSKDGRTQEVSAITMGLKQSAKTLRVPIIALAQLSRAVEMRQDKRPQLSDLRESGSIEQDADIVMFAFREHYYLTNSEPMARDTDGDDDLASRLRQWRKRMDETKNRMDIIGGKNRHGAVQSCNIWYEPAHDAMSDFSPHDDGTSTVRPYWMRED